MHIFVSVLGALVAAYFLRQWWETRHEQRAKRDLERALDRMTIARHGGKSKHQREWEEYAARH